MAILILLLGPILIMALMSEADRRSAAAEIAKLKKENMGLRKQLTESPHRRGSYGTE